MNDIEIYTDGASRGNPGPGSYGFIIMQNDKVILENSKYLGKTTNNKAEYNALIHALITAVSRNYKKIKVFTDSQLAVKQINGDWKINSPHLKPLLEKVKNLSNKFDEISFTHVRRNHKYIILADKLCNDELDQQQLKKK